jgi:3-hydroxybutyrate dehydrogenase
VRLFNLKDQGECLMTESLADRTAIVTGAGSGIGAAIASELARAGAHVVVQDLRLDAARSTVEAIRSAGGSADASEGDVTQPDQIRRTVDETVASRGRIDILVNNAGLQFVSPIDDYPLEKWNQLIAVLLTGPFLFIQAVLPAMRAQKHGRIINISSINGKRGEPGKAAYCSAKHGLIGLTRVASLETATDGITVNAICPGPVDTPLLRNQVAELAAVHGVSPDEALDRIYLTQIPQKRLVDPIEIASMVRYLASDEARSITGQAINVSAGFITH